ncbi:hypothetical protein Q4Q39_07730 [Flavivirga amylovorans]|uniref:Outer membrane protein beta-barrel domain-containing protein n=1 Tax=Flavivirga amylovorans TaxID=870486 RepID=A0ABT8X076_9FLAO|nr:hypothetical protein [Flavivirga amylovorans]MDO5987282.1 hypothetical protein [Flavivirga amylovorans]
MKQIYILLLCLPFFGFSQIRKEKSHGLFYKISLAATLTINKDYNINNDEGETFFNPSAVFLNNTVGYQFDKRTSLGLNFEYDYHSQQKLQFFPTYLNLRHNIIVDDENIFVRAGYGTLLSLNRNFEKGNIFKAGIGIQIFDQNFRNSFLIGLDFTRKRFEYETLEGLSSVSIFLEFMLF